ncbi:helix-turn-helix domain-containing protein [Paracraurococcus lichenis]|uniref:Helix-turn-helix domain-containing protein n=1 Tax=Paracraurococcus lichenis TaxID=3064888 RepID=A0ABT9ECL6_9PROT|nr:helix-turn-helix domain-containing protein [Paracraurococcus sp. LOR1-02]MDO9713816.1 helix-turn-helix domain-containing protein [Paracraurococcus sp. LOR1-02]
MSIFSHRFTDPEDLARAVRDAGIEYMPLEPGRYDASLTVVQAGALHIQRVVDQAHIVRGAVDLSRVGLLFSIRHRASPVINGCPLSEGHMLALAPGQEIHGLCPAHLEWGSFSFSTEAADRLFDLGGMRFNLSSTEPAPLVPAAIAARLRRAATEITNLAQRLSEQGRMTMPVACLAEGLMELCIEAFSRAEKPHLCGRATRDAIRLLNAADAFLHANIGRPIYTDDLCKALAVSPRKLHQAFVAACGMSPHAYLKRRRLMMVHQALKSGGQGESLVKSFALAHGFWHLGNFAYDYRRLFGQSPSETLMQARGGSTCR